MNAPVRAATASPPLAAGWWREPAAVARQSLRSPGGEAPRVSLRLADVVLDVDTTYAPLLADLRHAYGDCVLPPDATGDAMHVRCTVRRVPGTSLIVVNFAMADALPDLCEVALSMLRPRAELQHFVPRALDGGRWRLVANTLDDARPLLAAEGATAIVDVAVEPPEVLLNFVVGVAQLAQPDILFVHAGAVAIDGQGTLLVGQSGHGKSTTAAALASRGHPLLGDETVGLRAQPCEIVPFHRTMKLRPGPCGSAVAERLAAVPHAIRPDARGIPCAWVGGLFPPPQPFASVPLRHAFFLRAFRARAAAEAFVPSLDDLAELQALTMSLSAIVSWPISAAHRALRFARVVGLLRNCTCHFLDLGTPDETAALIESTVRSRHA